MQTIYTFKVENEWYEPLFTMDVDIDGNRDDTQEIAEKKAVEAVKQCHPREDESELEVWLKEVHVK